MYDAHGHDAYTEAAEAGGQPGANPFAGASAEDIFRHFGFSSDIFGSMGMGGMGMGGREGGNDIQVRGRATQGREEEKANRWVGSDRERGGDERKGEKRGKG